MAILAFAMVALIGIAGLVVDVGNAYALQRKVRNAVDSAALAGAGELAKRGATTNANVLSAVRRYAALNALREEDIEVWYCDLDGNALQPVNNDGFSPPSAVDGESVVGVLVRGRGEVVTYLARVVGVDTLRSAGSSMGWVSCGSCSAGNLFPAAISADAFSANDGTPYIGQRYTFWGSQTAPGNFGWLSWNTNPGHTSNGTLVANINNPSNSGQWRVGDWIPCGPGVQSSSSVRAALDAIIASDDPTVTVPVYNAVQGNGSNVSYRVVGFARMRLTDYSLTGRDKYLAGVFERWVEPSGEAGCADMGVCAVKLRQPMVEQHSIAGVVSIWEPELKEQVQIGTEHVPVDVVNVLDLSGSMNSRWGSGSGREVKLVTAKRVLTEFNSLLSPAEGDRAGLVTFPQLSYGDWYRTPCWSQWHNTYYLAAVRSQLTDAIASLNATINGLSANGATPLATAVQMGRQTVLPNGVATEGRVPVLIVASDGIANCTVDGRWTGFTGDTANAPSCNASAEQDAIEQALIAKQDGIIVFTIAVGDDFNSDVLRAMATEDTDPTKPHFFQAVSETDLEAIYQSLAVRVQNIGSECQVNEFESAGTNATVSIYKDGALYDQTTAAESGSYVFPDVEPGTYTFSVTMRKNGLTFDIMTDVIGGSESETPPSVTVGSAAGTYIRDLYLRSSTPLVCN